MPSLQNKNARVLTTLSGTMFSLLCFTRAADAQSALFSPGASFTPVAEPLWQQNQTNEFEVFNPAEESSSAGSSTQRQPFQWGPLVARPHVDYQFAYNTGLLATPGNPQDTTIQTVSPGILLDLGPYWALDYTPTLRFYSNPAFHNEFDNSVALNGATAYESWIFGLSQTFNQTSMPLIQTGTQTDQENADTALTANDQLNDTMSIDLALYQNLLFADDFQSSREWSTLDWFNYIFWPRLNAGVGAGFGFVNVDAGPNQTFEQLAGRVNWRATDKISFQVNAGFQEWQFWQSGANGLFTPTFGAVIQYQPFTWTKISLSGNRSVTPSYFADENTEITSVGADLNQRLLGAFYLDLNASYNFTRYVASAEGVSANRQDNYYLLSARLSHPFLKRGTASVFYQYSSDDSSEPGFSFNSKQVGFEIQFSY